ncbi:MAG: phosphoribosylanthranilate isomerase [Butyrivibrio sp.]|nr:phosphoribosylanthranilate isomerase [Butyrivibrio sp.]
MTKIKLCGLSRFSDVAAANVFKPDYVGFVFWKKSRRYIGKETAKHLRQELSPDIKTVGVFVDADIDFVTELLNEGIIDLAQLHGSENEKYIHQLREQTDKPIIKAFIIKSQDDIDTANLSSADHILVDSGMGEGKGFDYELLKGLNRPYFLAGGLLPENVKDAISEVRPFAVDVSSGIETDGHKDASKMGSFVANVRLIDAQIATTTPEH